MLPYFVFIGLRPVVSFHSVANCSIWVNFDPRIPKLGVNKNSEGPLSHYMTNTHKSDVLYDGIIIIVIINLNDRHNGRGKKNVIGKIVSELIGRNRKLPFLSAAAFVKDAIRLKLRVWIPCWMSFELKIQYPRNSNLKLITRGIQTRNQIITCNNL